MEHRETLSYRTDECHMLTVDVPQPTKVSMNDDMLPSFVQDLLPLLQVANKIGTLSKISRQLCLITCWRKAGQKACYTFTRTWNFITS